MKLPKTMGACADLLHDTREKRLALQKQVDALKADEARIADHVINNLDKRDETGAAGKRFRVQVVSKAKVRIRSESWADFMSWVGKNKAYDLVQRRINDTALADRLNVARAPKIPGVEKYNAVSLSLTKVK